MIPPFLLPSASVKMSLVQRCFPDEEDKPSPLFQHHISRSHKQVMAVRIGNRRKGLDGTGGDDHPIHLEGTTRQRAVKSPSS